MDYGILCILGMQFVKNVMSVASTFKKSIIKHILRPSTHQNPNTPTPIPQLPLTLPQNLHTLMHPIKRYLFS